MFSAFYLKTARHFKSLRTPTAPHKPATCPHMTQRKGQSLTKPTENEQPLISISPLAITSGPHGDLRPNHSSALHSANCNKVNWDSKELRGSDQGTFKGKSNKRQCMPTIMPSSTSDVFSLFWSFLHGQTFLLNKPHPSTSLFKTPVDTFPRRSIMAFSATHSSYNSFLRRLMPQ